MRDRLFYTQSNGRFETHCTLHNTIFVYLNIVARGISEHLHFNAVGDTAV